jgi:hypothetical protein
MRQEIASFIQKYRRQSLTLQVSWDASMSENQRVSFSIPNSMLYSVLRPF